MEARNFSEWFAFHGGEECVTRGASRGDFLRCWCAAIKAFELAHTQDAKGKSLAVSAIVKKYLKENGFDGLYNPGECACLIDDLIPCDSDPSICEAGYKSECPVEGCDLGGGCGFHIGPDKNEERGLKQQPTNGCTAAGASAPSAQILPEAKLRTA